MAVGNPNFDIIASTTLNNYRDKFEDNVFYGSPFYAFMRDKGRSRTEDSGNVIVEQLMYGLNSTFKAMSSQYGVVDVTPQTGATSAQYNWHEYTGSVVISYREMNINRSKAQIINLLDAKMTQLKESAVKSLNTDLFSTNADASSAGGLLGLQAAVAITPTTGTVGNIDRSDAQNTWWRNNSTASVGSFAAGGLDNMRTMFNTCSKDGSSYPDLILTTQSIFESYEKTGQTVQRLTSDQKMMDLGFTNFTYKGATMLWDSKCLSGAMYFLNTEYLRLVTMSGADLTMSDMKEPIDQMAKVAKYYFMGNVTGSNFAHQGVLSGITA